MYRMKLSLEPSNTFGWVSTGSLEGFTIINILDQYLLLSKSIVYQPVFCQFLQGQEQILSDGLLRVPPTVPP